VIRTVVSPTGGDGLSATEKAAVLTGH